MPANERDAIGFPAHYPSSRPPLPLTRDNHNLPLGWAQSLYIVAKLSLRKLLSEVR